LAVGDEVRQLTEQFNSIAIDAQPALQFIHETALLGWAAFPVRLGRMSCRMEEAGLYLHQEAEPLPAQLQALRAKKPLQQHFRIAIVNGFGSNLGDSTVGATALRPLKGSGSFNFGRKIIGDRPRFIDGKLRHR